MIFGIIICALLASVYIYPIFYGLIILPLDLLVSNSGPWYYANTILLKNSFMSDSVIQMYPWHRLTFQSLMHGIIPLWNPYQFMGMPFMANMKTMVFYPANIFFILGEKNSWNILLWLQLFLSLWFFYLFARELRLSKYASMLGGMAFAFSSFMMGVLEFGSEGHVLLWLPFLLFLVKRFIDRKQIRYLIGITLSVACSILAGQLQYFGIESLVLVIFIIYEWHVEKLSLKVITDVLVAYCFGFGLVAIQLIPLFELFRFSNRGLVPNYDIFNNGLSNLYSFLRFFSPDWFGNPVSHNLRDGYIEVTGYVGIIPLFFSLYGCFFGRNNRLVRFFAVIALTFAVLSLKRIGSLVSILHIPIITSGAGGRLFTMVLFSIAVLSAFGLDLFMREVDKKKRLRAIVLYGIILVIVYGFGILSDRFTLPFGTTLLNIRFPFLIAAIFITSMILYLTLLSRKEFKVLVVLIILGLTYLDLFRMGYRFLTFSNPKFLYPEIPVTSFVKNTSSKTLDRVLGLTDSEIYSALQVYSIDTYNPLYLKRSGLLMRALEDKSGSNLPTYKYEVEHNERMKYAADFLGISLVATGTDVNPTKTYWGSSPIIQNDLKYIYRNGRNDVFRNVGAYPRFGLYYQVKDNLTDEETLRLIQQHAVDFRTTLLLSNKLPVTLHEGSGSATLISSTVNSQRFTVKTTTPALFYVSDSYFPGWHATINGQQTQIYEANYNFRAILAPSGTSNVDFYYLPGSYIWGIIVSIASFLSFGAFCFWRLRFGSRKNDNVHTRE